VWLSEGDCSFLIVREVAEILNVSPMDVYRLASNGEIEAIRVGRAYRIPEEWLGLRGIAPEPGAG
jgi:excisionase family DNA binding protein